MASRSRDATLNRADRAERIAAYLEEKGAATYRELQPLLDVSEMTVRRDVDRLAQEGRLIKTLGGAQKANAPPDFYESSFLARSSSNLREKRTIAQKAFEGIGPGESLSVDGGSTCLELARILGKADKRLTVVTNSLLVSQEAGRSKGNTVLMLGGRYDPETRCVSGPTSEAQIAQYHVETAYLSTKGLIPNEGTYESSVGLFRIKQIMAARSRKVVLLADRSKFGRRALSKVLDIAQIHLVITDSADDETLSSLEKAGVTVLIARPQPCEAEPQHAP